MNNDCQEKNRFFKERRAYSGERGQHADHEGIGSMGKPANRGGTADRANESVHIRQKGGKLAVLIGPESWENPLTGFRQRDL